MQNYLIALCLVIVSWSCQVNLSGDAPMPPVSNSTLPGLATDSETAELFESFIDDSKIGTAGRNRVELQQYRRSPETSVVRLQFYRLQGDSAWGLRQALEFEKNSLIDLQPRIEDFDNDGFKDLTYISNVAARGANEIRKLFIYDENTDELVFIKNSENYPNLEYNKTLDCIDAWLFHGATTTVFLRLEGDVLTEFASVNTGAEQVVTIVGQDGTERVTSRRKMNEDDIFMRYTTFDPPR